MAHDSLNGSRRPLGPAVFYIINGRPLCARMGTRQAVKGNVPNRLRLGSWAGEEVAFFFSLRPRLGFYV